MLEILKFLFEHYFITIILAFLFVVLISVVVLSISGAFANKANKLP